MVEKGNFTKATVNKHISFVLLIPLKKKNYFAYLSNVLDAPYSDDVSTYHEDNNLVHLYPNATL